HHHETAPTAAQSAGTAHSQAGGSPMVVTNSTPPTVTTREARVPIATRHRRTFRAFSPSGSNRSGSFNDPLPVPTGGPDGRQRPRRGHGSCRLRTPTPT